MDWRVLYIIGNLLKCRCLKWAHMTHLDIWNTSYGGSGIKLVIWLLTIKNKELTQFPSMQGECEILLERFRQGLQLCFWLHLKPRFAHKVMGPQSHRSFNFRNFGTPIWESRDKMPFGCGPRGEAQSILQRGRWWLPPSLGYGESCESELPVAHPSTKSAPTMH